MKVKKFSIKNVLLFEPHIHLDDRGYFYENFNKKSFHKNTGIETEFVQENQSFSKKNVLRGLHYQIPPFEQGKLIKVLEGSIFDVAVDIRKNSKTFLSWIGEELTAKNHKQLWIPPGFAHGFLVLSNSASISYKTTNFYSPKHERSIIWNDSKINIIWPNVSNIQLSNKDTTAPKTDSLELSEFLI